MTDVRLEGLTLRVANVKRSMEFYGAKLGFVVEIDKAPHFAMIRVGGPTGGTSGLLPRDPANSGSQPMGPGLRAGLLIALTPHHLDELYQLLKAGGLAVFVAPDQQPCDAAMRP